jgi:AraC-like DNA-binding protein
MSMRFCEPEMLATAVRGAKIQPVQLSSRPAESVLSRVSLERCCLDIADLGPAMHFSSSMPEDCYTIIFVLKSPGKAQSFNFGAEYTDGYVGFFPPGAQADTATPACYRNAMLTIPVVQFHEALAIHFPDIPNKMLSQGAGMRIGPDGQAELRGLIRSLNEAMSDASEPLLNSIARQHFESELLAAFLKTLRSGCEQVVPQPSPRIAGRLRRFSQAREYLAEHAHEPLYMESVCNAVGLGSRAVEHLFRDYFGISPLAYLRHQRLHGVRRILQSAKPMPSLVKDAALKWGFWHLGRFARDYRVLFGESPRQTLAWGKVQALQWGHERELFVVEKMDDGRAEANFEILARVSRGLSGGPGEVEGHAGAAGAGD